MNETSKPCILVGLMQLCKEEIHNIYNTYLF